MRKIIDLAQQFGQEEEGAAFIEYAVLLGIILVASIATLAAVGGWVSAQWTGLCSELDGQGAGGSGSATGTACN